MRAGFPWRFTVLTFAISWGLWGLIAASGSGLDGGLVVGLAYVLGGFGPTIAALVLVRRRRSGASWADLSARLFEVERVRARWWAVILLLYPVVVLSAYLVGGLAFPGTVGLPGSSGLLSQTTSLLVLNVLFILVVGPVSEEPGWRGYALDRLQARWTPLVASLVLGVVWWAWHLPLLAVPGSFLYGFSSSPTFIAGYLGTVLLYSILFTWVYDNNQRSVLATVAMHFSINLTTGILAPPFEVFAITTGLLILVTAVVVVRERMWERPSADSDQSTREDHGSHA
jgi:membrane protease YdiL (CAAX protease family)